MSLLEIQVAYDEDEHFGYDDRDSYIIFDPILFAEADNLFLDSPNKMGTLLQGILFVYDQENEYGEVVRIQTNR